MSLSVTNKAGTDSMAISLPLNVESRASSRTGQTLVEFALVLPVFLVVLFGLLDVGRYVYMNSVLSQAAREGARLGAAGQVGSARRPQTIRAAWPPQP